MIDNHHDDFEQIVQAAGIPTTEEEMRAEWDQINEDNGSQISNDSRWSPFWRLISEIVTKPALWTVQFLINQLLPNSFIKTATGMFLDILAWALNLIRKDATKAVGMITFIRENTTTSIVIGPGTVIQSTPINGQVYELITTETKTFPDGELTVEVEAKAMAPGENYNLAPGYYSVLPEDIAGVTEVNNGQEWLTTPGADKESDDELRLRCRNQFTAVGLFHHDAAYKQIISEFAGIRTDYLYFEHEAPRGPGTANCYIMIESGIPPQDFIDDINQHVDDNGYHGHGDSMICYPMPDVETDVVVTVWPVANLDAQERTGLQEGVENYIRAAFRQNNEYSPTQTWPQSRFSFSKLTQKLHRTFPEIESLDFDNRDIVTAIELATLGELTVKMEY
ncbi:baseplate J family protein [Endozoicomonas montiporae CL-33]|uniref:Baseplate J family protein n=1 Tax=Endozoicomonas montiporae CL-33 TaxID=570277 RepID=A0A142BB66_9GAMM|nr:baseplate J/gp47 family protein [Endozoicomonas montiporae]AMO55992.1 baseplate J family protein [Endozoicomonas montiporae CL-33]